MSFKLTFEPEGLPETARLVMFSTEISIRDIVLNQPVLLSGRDAREKEREREGEREGERERERERVRERERGRERGRRE